MIHPAETTEDDWNSERDDYPAPPKPFANRREREYYERWHNERAKLEALEERVQPLYELPFAQLKEIPVELDRLKDEVSYHRADAKKWNKAAVALAAALKDAIDAVRIFHGPECWEIYRDNSPEMARWKEALAKVGAGETAS